MIHGPNDPEFEDEKARSPVRSRPARSSTAEHASLWRAELGSGAIPSPAALARREGLSRARITQILALTSIVPGRVPIPDQPRP